MDTVTISDLLSVEDIGSTDVLPIVNGGSTKKVSIDKLGDVFTTKTYVTNKIQEAIASAAGDFGFTPIVVQTLPTQDIDEHTIYLVPKTGETGDIYDEYIYINNAWEHIGSTSVDLSNYLAKNNTISFTPSGDYNPATKKYVDDIASGKQDNLTAGSNITIDANNVISATGGGSNVIANPTLAGTEDALTGLQVGETKYKVDDIYPTELKLGTGTGTETKIVQTTQYGDPEIAVNYAVTTNVGTFWMTALEPNMTGKKLKSFTIKTKNSNRKMTIMGSMVPAGDPYENRSTLSALAVTTNQDSSTKAIVELNTVAGIHKYYLDGTDPNVTIVTQSYIDNCPASVGLLKTGDTESFYYNNNMPSNGYGYYWNGTGNTYTERLGLIFEYETEVEVEVPAIELKLNDNTKLSCNITSTSIGATQWENIVIDFMGDSITEGYPSNVVTKSYCETLAEKLGSTAKIYGIGGSTIANGSDAMYSRVLNMNSTADLIFIFGGTNDFAIQSRVLGNQFTTSNNVRTLNTDTSTFYGGLNQLCLNLLSAFPYSTYVFLTPLHRNNYESQPTDLQANSNGLYLDQYVECIKNVAKWFSIPVIDLYGESSLYPLDSTQRSQYFVGSSDGVHPNQEGHDIIAQCIYDKLKSITKKGETL